MVNKRVAKKLNKLAGEISELRLSNFRIFWKTKIREQRVKLLLKDFRILREQGLGDTEFLYWLRFIERVRSAHKGDANAMNYLKGLPKGTVTKLNDYIETLTNVTLPAFSRPKVGILAKPSEDGRLYGESNNFYKSLVEVGHDLGLCVFTFGESDVNFEKKSLDANFIITSGSGKKLWVRRKVSFPKVVYDRATGIPSTFRTKLEKAGMILVNPPELIGLAGDKWQSYSVLNRAGITATSETKQAETMLYSLPNLKTMIAKHSVVFLKPRRGSQGIGIMSLSKTQDGYLLKPNNQKFKSSQLNSISQFVSGNYIVQQGIAVTKYNNAVFDIRVLIQKNNRGKLRLTGMVARVSTPGQITSNLHTGGSNQRVSKVLNNLFGASAFRSEFKKKIENASFKTFHAIEDHLRKKLCEIAIDIMVDTKGDLYIIEINSKPGRASFRFLGDDFRTNAVRRPMEFTSYLLNNT
ncbi:YheC/YheD family protein [Candidatus Woesearchaeota archaeon]|nr:YheC/YheD family protein [Candidatus Woesearchaeota archaeon]MBT3537793.1 YheC/YheD family protein [Candidatus Woesearchaeota archaeon]MBT4697924.1 YheC/YheD family protein [Candidatus Woesearchaeota archaeon]MBT4717303.1 YheC/YheD family protein [Candidatus Woesearchaeota archaeon]MBT7105462.1 YheC/YheD family protein [Candidatus Woesearchaeota archaeon]